MLQKDILTCFEILEVNPDSSFTEVQRAYREMAKVWHPDRFPNDSSLQSKGQEKLKQINQAYKKLQEFFENPEGFQCNGPSKTTTDRPMNPVPSSANPPNAGTTAHEKGVGLAFIVGIVAFIILCFVCRFTVGGGLFSEPESQINWPGVFIGTGIAAFIAYHIGNSPKA